MIFFSGLRFPFRSTRAQVAAFLSVVFLVSFGISGFATWLAISLPNDDGIQSQLLREASAIAEIYTNHKQDQAIKLITQRENHSKDYAFQITNPQGKRLAGNLPVLSYPEGFSKIYIPPPAKNLNADPLRIAVFSLKMTDGVVLLIGKDLGKTRQVRDTFLRSFIFTAGSALFIGLAIGLNYVTRVLRRIETIAATADAISSGNMNVRAPVRPPEKRDDIDHLAIAINRMLNEIENLVSTVRQISNDVAHDLRTPLFHLRQRLETGLDQPFEKENYRAILSKAVIEIDNILNIFASLLKIGQLESGVNALPFQKIDLTEVATAVADAFRPSAEDSGHRLILDTRKTYYIQADKALITQMLANLVENALIHTPSGTTIEIRILPLGESVRFSVEDDGPGLVDEDLEKIFHRFYRGDHSRGSPGSGLGLSLAAAVAHAHGASIRSEDANPGLRITVDFPKYTP